MNLNGHFDIHFLFTFFLTLGFLVSRLFDFRLSLRNLQMMKIYELKKSKNPIFLMLPFFEIALFFLMISLSNRSFDSFSPVQLKIQKTLAVSLILIAFFIRKKSQQELGVFWNILCVFPQGAAKVTSGIYRFFKHPDALSRVFEFLGYGLFFRLSWDFFFSVLTVVIFYLLFLIQTENNFFKKKDYQK